MPPSDADFDVGSSCLQALGIQQAPGIQSPSIANQGTAIELKIFGAD